MQPTDSWVQLRSRAVCGIEPPPWALRCAGTCSGCAVSLSLSLLFFFFAFWLFPLIYSFTVILLEFVRGGRSYSNVCNFPCLTRKSGLCFWYLQCSCLHTGLSGDQKPHLNSGNGPSPFLPPHHCFPAAPTVTLSCSQANMCLEFQ